MMRLKLRVVGHTQYPPLLTRDDLLNIIRVEDQFGRRRIRRLLTDLHHVERQPLDIIAEKIDVPVDTLRIWLYWLHIEELEIALEVTAPEPEEVQPAVLIPKESVPEEPRQSPFEGVGVGIITHRIITAWQATRSWKKAAGEMKVTLDQLRDWVDQHRTEFAGHISSKNMSLLLKDEKVSPEVTPPAVFPDHYGRLSGIILSQEAREAIEQYCQTHGCTEKELFTDRYNPARIADTANEIGIGVMIYLKLVEYYRGTIVQTVGG